ncbi:hypothetical protein BOTBODRAFT_520650 [Botryobasidium botryosum FD-172 SS1]|uniref:Uncharacterized protein n=1 Tax=Botryobasidium botryosum (strain FD-172 SS1) TaxID=930990 RepID=A0A067M2B5_BOTB1|nr:hypothetical protein BOTBODRAFT_520650 [Botryobasidium botryosum FD-172 SS1]
MLDIIYNARRPRPRSLPPSPHLQRTHARTSHHHPPLLLLPLLEMLANITLAMAAFAAASNHNPFQAPAQNITSSSALFRLSVPHGDFFFFNLVKFVPRSPIPTTNATNLTTTDVNNAGNMMIATNIFATTHAANIPPAPTATSFTTTAPPAATTAPPFTALRPAATTLPSPPPFLLFQLLAPWPRCRRRPPSPRATPSAQSPPSPPPPSRIQALSPPAPSYPRAVSSQRKRSSSGTWSPWASTSTPSISKTTPRPLPSPSLAQSTSSRTTRPPSGVMPLLELMSNGHTCALGPPSRKRTRPIRHPDLSSSNGSSTARRRSPLPAPSLSLSRSSSPPPNESWTRCLRTTPPLLAPPAPAQTSTWSSRPPPTATPSWL